MADIKIDPQGDDLSAWQIGSSKPPGVCLCCGSKFDDGKHKLMGPYLELPYIWVCQWCHDKPFLFFPDKRLEPQYRDPYARAPPSGQSTLD